VIFGGQEHIRRVQGWIAAADKRILPAFDKAQFERVAENRSAKIAKGCF
jgi:hypothetical protein